MTDVPLDRLTRVSVAVHDLDAALSTYSVGLGLKVRSPVMESPRGFGLRWVELGSSSHTFLELLAPTRDDSPVGRFLAQRGEGVYQVRLATRDVDAQLGALRQRGIRTIEDPQPDGGLGWVHPASTHGVLIELADA